MVLWLIGLSGSGKTTLGRKLKERFDAEGRRSYLLDGDIVRDFFDRDLGYTRENRIENIKRIQLAAFVLAQNGVEVIVCNISPVEELRRFHRKKIPGYLEIYLKRAPEDCAATDDKGVYVPGAKHLVGVDQAFDEPQHPDLTLDTGKEPVEKSLERLLAFLSEIKR